MIFSFSTDVCVIQLIIGFSFISRLSGSSLANFRGANRLDRDPIILQIAEVGIFMNTSRRVSIVKRGREKKNYTNRRNSCLSLLPLPPNKNGEALTHILQCIAILSSKILFLLHLTLKTEWSMCSYGSISFS